MLPKDGTLPTSQGEIYRVPTGGRANITGIEVANQSGAAATYTLYLKIGNVPRLITDKNVAINDGILNQYEFPRTLNGGAIIEAVASAELDFVISGTESGAV